MNSRQQIKKILWITIFGITMGYFEASVVVYLRAIYFPDGFTLPLTLPTDSKITVEVFREVASMIMLMAVAAIAGKKFWERFAYFIITFGVWDIFYYVFLKVILDWPAALLDQDILYLIPLPWIGPVIAPVSISVIMIIAGILIAYSCAKGSEFSPSLLSYVLSIIATAIILYSFMYDTGATLHQQMPKPYRYDLLIIGDLLFIVAFMVSYIKSRK
jgi:hypothetical protein